jgi:NADPH:quinone reductase-like Zn-dependent oxidoreductase
MTSLLQSVILGPLISRLGKKKTRFFFAKRNKKDLLFLKELLETSKITPIIDRRYPLSQAAEALRYHEEGHARGKVVITMSEQV